MTVDGAAFNNAFGIGGNLPGNGSPISLDALDQVSVSSSPYDVRLSGFTGGAISAVTKSGTNQFKGTAYMYTTNSHLRGDKVSDYELNRLQSHSTTWGVSLGVLSLRTNSSSLRMANIRQTSQPVLQVQPE